MILLTVAEAAHRLGVSPDTLRRWSDGGIIPALRLPTSLHRRYRPEDVAALMSDMEAEVQFPVEATQ